MIAVGCKSGAVAWISTLTLLLDFLVTVIWVVQCVDVEFGKLMR